MSYTLPFSVLKSRHEKAVEAFCKVQTVAFEERAKVLLKRIQKELTDVHRLASCNGSFWLMGKDFDTLYEVEFIVGEDRANQWEAAGTIYKDNLRHLFNYFGGYGDKPKVSDATYKALNELYDLATYCEDETRVHTTTSIDVEA